MIFEAKIQVSNGSLSKASAAAKDLNWQTALSGGKFYLLTQSDNSAEIFARLMRAVKALEFDGVTVLQEKVSIVIHDTTGEPS